MNKPNRHIVPFVLMALTLGGALLFLLPTSKAYAQSCASDFQTVMENGAILQARREAVINQMYIRKPDSILEYICMGDLLEQVAEEVGPLFSETDDWADRTVPLITSLPGETVITQELGPTSLDEALALVVNTRMVGYINANFGHSFLGGAGGDYVPGNPCGIMSAVWQEAKSFNFNPDGEGGVPFFPDMEELVDTDPRVLPEPSPGTDITEEMIEISEAANTPEYGYTEPTLYDVDFLTRGTGCAQTTVLTGRTAFVREAVGRIGQIVEYPDGFCMRADCTYTQGGVCE